MHIQDAPVFRKNVFNWHSIKSVSEATVFSLSIDRQGVPLVSKSDLNMERIYTPGNTAHMSQFMGAGVDLPKFF